MLNFQGIYQGASPEDQSIVVPPGSTYVFGTPVSQPILYEFYRTYEFDENLIDTDPTEGENFDNLMNALESEVVNEISQNFNVAGKTIDAGFQLGTQTFVFEKHKGAKSGFFYVITGFLQVNIS